MDFFARFDPEKLRLNLKLSAARLEMNRNKRVNDMERQKKEIATLLKDPSKEELARIRTEHFVRDDRTAEVYAILNLMCVLLMERTKMLIPLTDIPYDMRETIASLVYAADKVDIPELLVVKKQLLLKFNKNLTNLLETEANQKENVNERVMEKLSVKPPSSLIVTAYMKEIAKEKAVNWIPSVDTTSGNDVWEAPMPAPKGNAITGIYGELKPKPSDFTSSNSGFPTPPTNSVSNNNNNMGNFNVNKGLSNPGNVGFDGFTTDGNNNTTNFFPSVNTNNPPPKLSGSNTNNNNNFGGLGPAPVPPKRSTSFNNSPVSSLQSPPIHLSSQFPGMDDTAGLPSDVFSDVPHVPVGQGANAVPDFDELSRRFEALKKS
jgi:vacuolar protein sorting-associated protein IST1